MTAVKKFMFDTDFGPPPKAKERPVKPSPKVEKPAAPEPPAPETYSAEELESARQAGIQEGRQEALRQAAEQTEHEVAKTLDALQTKLANIDQRYAEMKSEMHDAAVQIALAVVRKLFPDFVRRHGAGEVLAVVEEALARMISEPRIIIRINDEALGQIEERIQALAANHGTVAGIEVIGDPAIAAGDCQVDWTEGGTVRDSERLWREIDGIVAQYTERSTGEADSAPAAAPGNETSG